MHGLEVMHSVIDSVTTGQVRIKDVLNAQFVYKYIRIQFSYVISIPNITIKNNISE